MKLLAKGRSKIRILQVPGEETYRTPLHTMDHIDGTLDTKSTRKATRLLVFQ